MVFVSIEKFGYFICLREKQKQMNEEVRIIIEPIQDPEKIKKVGEYYRINSENSMNYFRYWNEHTLFHWDFWLSWGIAIVPWIIWAYCHKQQSRGRLLLAGFLAVIISSWLDFYGVNIGLWYYTGLAIPTIPSYVPWDFSLIPVLTMFMIQIKPQSSVWGKAFLFAFTSAFLGEPLFLWLGFYRLLHWNLFFSVPIYFILFIICHKISRIKFGDQL